MEDRQSINYIETTIAPKYKQFQDIKSRTTQGKLRIIGNNVFVNLANVLTVPGRFVTPEEQKANLDLWVLAKDETLVEDLYKLMSFYKSEHNKSKYIRTLCFWLLMFFMTIINALIWYLGVTPK